DRRTGAKCLYSNMEQATAELRKLRKRKTERPMIDHGPNAMCRAGAAGSAPLQVRAAGGPDGRPAAIFPPQLHQHYASALPDATGMQRHNLIRVLSRLSLLPTQVHFPVSRGSVFHVARHLRVRA